nr:amidohydrolase family protein [Escherichia coli]
MWFFFFQAEDGIRDPEMSRGLGSKSDSAGDVALAAAVQVTSATPARALGLTGVGRLAAGYAANLVVLDRDLRVTAVMVNDDWRVG